MRPTETIASFSPIHLCTSCYLDWKRKRWSKGPVEKHTGGCWTGTCPCDTTHLLTPPPHLGFLESNIWLSQTWDHLQAICDYDLDSSRSSLDHDVTGCDTNMTCWSQARNVPTHTIAYARSHSRYVPSHATALEKEGELEFSPPQLWVNLIVPSLLHVLFLGFKEETSIDTQCFYIRKVHKKAVIWFKTTTGINYKCLLLPSLLFHRVSWTFPWLFEW